MICDICYSNVTFTYMCTSCSEQVCNGCSAIGTLDEEVGDCLCVECEEIGEVK